METVRLKAKMDRKTDPLGESIEDDAVSKEALVSTVWNFALEVH